MLLSLLLSIAHAGPTTTRDALDRLEEVLQLRVEDGLLDLEQALPAILVRVQPRYEDSVSWFATGAIESLERALGRGSMRLCEACMVPRVWVEDGHMAYQTGPIGLDEVARLDASGRGGAQPARSAIWVDEYRGGVSVRIVSLETGQVLFAQNIDPDLTENTNSQRMYTLSEELERRARGDSLTQAFADFALYPGQHVSLDWTDQWGPTNRNLSGVSISAFDPVLGIGACHYRALPVLDMLVGGKVLLSLPTAAARSIDSSNGDIVDPLLNVALVARVPFGRRNYGGVISLSTNGQVGIGVSLMNISLLPVIP